MDQIVHLIKRPQHMYMFIWRGNLRVNFTSHSSFYFYNIRRISISQPTYNRSVTSNVVSLHNIAVISYNDIHYSCYIIYYNTAVISYIVSYLLKTLLRHFSSSICIIVWAFFNSFLASLTWAFIYKANKLFKCYKRITYFSFLLT